MYTKNTPISSDFISLTQYMKRVFYVVSLIAVKPACNGHSQIDKTKIIMTNSSLMKVKSVLQYLRPALSDNWF